MHSPLCRRICALTSIGLLLYLPSITQAVTNPVGGGILHSGLVGTYFSDTEFGSEAFSRRDLRLDFDWGTVRQPGGSLAWTRLGQVAADNYSVRWEGQLMPRFSETYTLTAYADSVRIWIKPAADPAFADTPLIDYWPASDPDQYAAQSAAYAFEAGLAYDIRIEYRERTGPAMMRLLWSSPSTPLEVIQPTAMVGEIPPQRGVILADAVQSASNWGENYPSASTNPRRDGVLEVDADGWPTEDFSFILRPTDRTLHLGTYLLMFEGMARVQIGVGGGQLMSADGSVAYGTATASDGTMGYDPATNTTTLRVVISNSNSDSFWPGFQNTRRSPAHEVNTGVRHLRLLRPSGIGSTTPHDNDELFAREALATLETFVTFRWNDVNGTSDSHPGGPTQGRWQDRRHWGPNSTNTSFTSENHEYKILLSNHSGRDLYIQVPHASDDDYIRQLARLIRFGADAAGTPYTSAVAAPHYPPLNPNLRVNVEYSNEIPWNTAGQYPQSNWARVQPEVRRQAWLADPASHLGQSWEILNFDNLLATDNASGRAEGLTWGKRFTALRTVEMSNIFREVFGDEAMQGPGKQDPRVRVLYMYQYDNANGTATDAFNFIDGYFNRIHPLSTYSGDPKPVSHFIYGGGAATYYASADRHGTLLDHPLSSQALGTFEAPVLGAGEALIQPVGSPWVFSGSAGIYREARRFAGTYGTLTEPTKVVDAYSRRGMRITVGPQDVALYEVGRYVHAGSAGNTTISVFPVDTADDPNRSLFAREFSLNNWPVGSTAWQRTGRNIFIISNKAYSHPIILQAGKSYLIVATEVNNGNPHSAPMEFIPPPGVSVTGSVLGRYNTNNNTWIDLQIDPTPNRSYGPLNFKIAPAPIATNTGLSLGFLHDARNPMEANTRIDNHTFSPQAAFIAGTGSMEIEITFPAPGYYGLIYGLAHKPDQRPYDPATSSNSFENRPRTFLIEDGTPRNISPAGQTDQFPSTGAWNHEGYWVKPHSGFDFYGSAPFHISDTTKSYRIRFEGTNASTNNVVLIDNVLLASADKMTEGTIPSGGGFAEGAPDVSNWEARVMSMYKYAQAFGLRAMSYEGGWYPGGDANKMPLQFTSSFFAEAMVDGEINAINALNRAGLAVNTDYTFEFAMPVRGVANPEDYRRIQAWRQLNAGLAAEPTNGQPLTSIFTANNSWLRLRTSNATLQNGGWFSWNVIAPQSGYYFFTLETTGSGTVSVRVNENEVPVSGSAGSTLKSVNPVFLTKGLHSLRVVNLGNNSELVALSVTQQNQPAGFNGLAGSPGNAEVALSWPAVAGASGYHVYYKTRLASQFTRVTASAISANTFTVQGLLNDSTYNFVVTYVDISGSESAFSNQVDAVPSEVAVIMAWEFDDSTDKQAQVNSGLLTPRAQSPYLAPGTSLTVGPWRIVDTNGHMVQDSLGFGGGWGLAEIPLRDDHYVGLSITPVAGALMRVTELQFGLWWSRDANKSVNLYGCELRFSTDGFQSYQVIPLSPDSATVPSGNGTSTTGRRLTADLGHVPALRALASGTNAEFRIHFYGEGVSYWGIGKLGATVDDLILYGFPVDASAVETPTTSPAPGTYAAPLTVTLSTATPGAYIRYTLDGSLPDESNGTLINASSGSFTLSATASVRAVAIKDGMTPSAVLTRNFEIAPVVATPQFSLAAGIYNGPQQLAISTLTSSAQIRYTLDGTTPTPTSGLLYTGPLTLSTDAVVRAIAYRSGFVASPIGTASYSINLESTGAIALYFDAVSTPEQGGNLVVNVRRLDGYAGPASVHFATADGTATAEADFTAVSGSLDWAAGDSSDKQIVIPILDDQLGEGDEDFYLILSNASGASLGSPSSMTITIVDDDTPIISLATVVGAVINAPFDLGGSVTGIGSVTTAWSVVSQPAGSNLTIANPGALNTTALTASEGIYVLRLAATDSIRTNVRDVSVFVAYYNHPPALAIAPGVLDAVANEPFSHVFPAQSFTDLEGAPISYSVIRANDGPLPDWLVFDPDTRTLSGTPRAIDIGSLPLRLIATDADGASSSVLFSILINRSLQLIPLLVNDFSTVSTGNYNGALGTPMGSDSLLGNVSGANTALRVNATGGVAGSAGLDNVPDLAVRSRTTLDFRSKRIHYSAYLRFQPSISTATGGFFGMGLSLPAGADGTGVWNSGNNDKLLIGLRRVVANPANTIRLDALGAIQTTTALTGNMGDTLQADFTSGHWYQLSFEMTFNPNATEPSQSTVTVRNLRVRDWGADGLSGGIVVLSLAESMFNHPSGSNLDTADQALVFVAGNRDRGTHALDNLHIQVLEFESGNSPFNAWAETIDWPLASDPSPIGVVNQSGISNLLAYALNIDPTSAALARFLPSIGNSVSAESGHRLHLTTRQRTGEHGLSFTLLGSTSLTDWEPLAVDPLVLDPDYDGDGTTRLIQYSVPVLDAPANPLFLRLGIAAD
jgi:hypothetical protein